MRKRQLLLLLSFFALLTYQLVTVHSQSSVGIFINIRDTTPPVINITKLAPTSISLATLTGTYSEDTVLANITIELNSSYKVQTSFNTTNKTWSAAANLTEGWNKFYVLAYDTSGNFVNATSSSQDASVLLDITKPAINLTSPKNGSSVANNSLIAFKISDLGLTDAFYTVNSGATTSFNSVYELKAGTSDWVNVVNYIIVNATDSTNNVESKNFSFTYTNNYAVVLTNSIVTAEVMINDTNETINNLQNSADLQSLVNNFAAAITVEEYNKTIQVLDVVANLSNAVESIQTLLQEILDANSSSQNNATKTETINAKIEEIIAIKNTTVLSIDVNLFNPNLTIVIEDTTKNNVTNQIFATVAGLSASDEQSFRAASEALQNKTTLTNKVQTLTQTFLNGRTENITLFEKSVSLSETQSGQFYVNEIIDKNITGNNNLNANTGITNRVSQAMDVVVADPTVRWSFDDAAGAVISYNINENVPSDRVSQSQTVLTTVPTVTRTGTTSSGGGTSGGGSGKGGGGSGLITVKREFTLSKEALKVVLKQGQIKEETFAIKNTGDVTLAIEVDPKNLENFVTFQDIDIGNLVLLPGQEQTITFVFKAHEDQKPDIYPGEILFKGQSVEKKIPTIVEVDSASPLFDADVQVLPQYKSILPGNSILIEVSLFNVRGFGRVDVNLEYSISDFQGNLIATEHETVAVETQAKFSRELLIPADTGPGTYIASVKVTFENSVGISSDSFEVRAKAIRLIPVPIRDLVPYLVMGIVVVGLIVYMFVVHGPGLRGKKQIPKTKEEESKLLKTEEKIKKLEKELAALESAYKSGFISEESYKNNKERVDKELDKLRKE